MIEFEATESGEKKWKDIVLKRIKRVENTLTLVIVALLALLTLLVWPNINDSVFIQVTPSDIYKMEKSIASLQSAQDAIIHKYKTETTNYMETISHLREKVSRMEHSNINNAPKERNQIQEDIIEGQPYSAMSRSEDYQPYLQTRTEENITNSTRKLQQASFFADTEDYHCSDLPILSPLNHLNDFVYIEKMEHILNVIQSLSPTKFFTDFNSPQYEAACWMLYDDTLEFLTINEYFMERYVLAVLLYGTGMNEGTLLSLNTCEFEVVGCDSDGRITSIHISSLSLPHENFQRTIPFELSHLRRLEQLILVNNSLVGTLPPELGRLSSLKYLDLSRNLLTGTFPTEIGSLSNLNEIILSWNHLNGTIPSQLGQCTLLTHFHLSMNMIEGTIPKELFDCKHLEVVDVFQNGLTGNIPTEIGLVEKLSFFRINNNKIHGHIPSEIGILTSLDRLWIAFNELSGSLPTEIAYLLNLNVLVANTNKFTGTMPDIFGNLTNLEVIQLSDNNLTGSIPSSVWDIDYYLVLSLFNNDLYGRVPNDFCSRAADLQIDHSSWFRSEEKVNCSCCGDSKCYIWEINEDFVKSHSRPSCHEGNIETIKFFQEYHVEDNVANISLHDFRGKDFYNADLCLSPFGCYTLYDMNFEMDYNLSYSKSSNILAKQDQCDAVEICGNQFHQNHPKRMRLNHIAQLIFSKEDLQSPEYSSSVQYKALCLMVTEDPLFEMYDICNGALIQRYIMVLFLVSHDLEFNFNEDTCNWRNVTCDDLSGKFVEHLNFRDRNLKGALITELGRLTKLKTIDLSENDLRGELSQVIFSNMPYLEVINVAQNHFDSSIPENLWSLPKLKEVNLSSNLFQGTLPNNINYSKDLESVDIHNNLLQGNVPRSIFALDNLYYIDFKRNGFTGRIPTEIGLAKNLKVINLHRNSIRGSIPLELVNAFHIEILILQSNLLTGTIPTQFGNLQNIRNVSLSYNMLEGTIPKSFELLQDIKQLHLHNNHLTGFAPNVTTQDLDYITDCGSPSFSLLRPLECKECTICCNSLGVCQKTNVIDWPLYSAYLFSFLLPIVAASAIYAFFKAEKLGGFSNEASARNILSLYNEDSVYCLVFSSNKIAWSFYFMTAVVQVLLFFIFLASTDFSSVGSAWIYTLRCPSNKMTCDDGEKRTLGGWVLFYIVTLLFLGNDLADGMLQLRKAVALRDYRLFLSGGVLLFLTLFALTTSALYNTAVAISNTDLIVNTVILLFINDIDEKLLDILDSLFPDWIADRYDEIQKNLLAKCPPAPDPDQPECERRLSLSRLDKLRFAGRRDSIDSLEDIPANLNRLQSGLRILGFDE